MSLASMNMDFPDGRVVQQFEFPLRSRGDIPRFWFYLILGPSLLTVLLAAACGLPLFPEKLTFAEQSAIALAHFLTLGVFTLLLWVPTWLAVKNWPAAVESTLVVLRNFLVVGLVLFFIPHKLILGFLSGPGAINNPNLKYAVLWGIVAFAYLGLSIYKQQRSAYSDIRSAKNPLDRGTGERYVWFDSLTFFLLLVGIILVELWFFAQLGEPGWQWQPEQIFMKAAFVGRFQAKIQLIGNPELVFGMSLLAWWGSSVLTALPYFLWASLGNRLMANVLIPVTFHERDVQGVIQKSYRYLWHFALAMLFRYPFMLVGGLFLTLIFLAIPIVFISAGQYELLDKVTAADQMILALGVFMAWFSPLSLAVSYPDETFGEYFNQRLRNHLLMVQGHIVVVGFGNLGKRVLDREVGQLFNDKTQRSRRFEEVVTPDLRLEWLCNQVVVVERDPGDIIYSGSNNLLGDYGVVTTLRRRYRTRDPQNNPLRAEKRVLVPVVVGDAGDPFIRSRVNLERARLVISMVTDGKTVQTIFDRAVLSRVSAIISVSRSDQVVNLTARARHRRIVLHYPKHNQGNTLGYRLWAAMLKVSALQALSPAEVPRVMVLGLSKSTHYMLETLYTLLPRGGKGRGALLEDTLALILPAGEVGDGHPRLLPNPGDVLFDQLWPTLLNSGGRASGGRVREPNHGAIHLRTRIVNDGDVLALENCLREHQPGVLVVNHDVEERGQVLLLRCIQALERIKAEDPQGFRLPLLLLANVRGAREGKNVFTDSSRYYDALCKMYKEPLAMDISYPAHARFDYYTREMIGETISDSYADAEEVIAGARRAFSLNTRHGSAEEKARQFVEISSCLPNHPAALANYLSRLSGVEFSLPAFEVLQERWGESGFPEVPLALPTFQYLRHIKLGDEAGNGFALTGYAALVPVTGDSSVFNPDLATGTQVSRVFANDGRSYAEKEPDPDETRGNDPGRDIARVINNLPDPAPPGVPEVIDRLTNRAPGTPNSVSDFQRVAYDPAGEGRYACPGMNLCRIAAYQNAIAANNNLRLARQETFAGDPSDKLWHARNYFCCSGRENLATEPDKPHSASHFARISCCSSGHNRPGQLAVVLNALLMRSNPRFREKAGSGEEWRINIDYFKDMTCQNNYFRVNRLFGVFDRRDISAITALQQNLMPLHMIRILPIGNHHSARSWYAYARMLYHFLAEICPNDQFEFSWLCQHRNKHIGLEDIPDFEAEDPARRPVVFMIRRLPPEDAVKLKDACRLCGRQERRSDCHKLRVWV